MGGHSFLTHLAFRSDLVLNSKVVVIEVFCSTVSHAAIRVLGKGLESLHQRCGRQIETLRVEELIRCLHVTAEVALILLVLHT